MMVTIVDRATGIWGAGDSAEDAQADYLSARRETREVLAEQSALSPSLARLLDLLDA